MSKIVDVEVIEHKGNGIIVKILDDSYASLGRIRHRELQLTDPWKYGGGKYAEEQVVRGDGYLLIDTSSVRYK